MRSRPRLTRAPGAALLIATTVVAAACASHPLAPYQASLEGSWAWVESTGGVAGRSFTPASEGYAVTYRFMPRGRLAVLRDGKVRVNTGYTLEKSDVNGQPTQVLVQYGLPVGVFKFDPDVPEQRIAALRGDTLRLADPCCDRYTHLFVRAR